MDSDLDGVNFSRVAAGIHPAVLVIDNEPLVRWSLVAGLRHAGFDAIAAGTAEDARQLACQVEPDLVLLDVRLWNTDAPRLLDEIRVFSPACQIVILAVEGQDLTLPAWRGIAVVRKPFDLDAVVDLVGRMLSDPVDRIEIPM